jgi:hypothetical protein
MDKDNTKQDDFLGEVRVPVSSIIRAGTLENWFELQPGSGWINLTNR